jgi:predicted kinase
MIDLNMCDNLGRFNKVKENEEYKFNYSNLRTLFERVDIANLMRQYKDAKPHNFYYEHEATLLIGLAGSGKSTWRNENAINKNIICRDDILMEMGNGKKYSEAYTTVNGSQVNAELKARWEEHLRKREDVILDMTNLVKSHRNEFLQRLPKTYKRKAIIFLCGWSELMKRNDYRAKKESKRIPEHVYYEMAAKFEMPSFEDFDEITFRLDGKDINIF